MSHIVGRCRPLISRSARIRGYFEIKKRKGDARIECVVRYFRFKNTKNILPKLTSQIWKMKLLKNLRCKPKGSEVFRCGSIGI
jgi:hypothetical protein